MVADVKIFIRDFRGFHPVLASAADRVMVSFPHAQVSFLATCCAGREQGEIYKLAFQEIKVSVTHCLGITTTVVKFSAV